MALFQIQLFLVDHPILAMTTRLLLGQSGIGQRLFIGTNVQCNTSRHRQQSGMVIDVIILVADEIDDLANQMDHVVSLIILAYD